MNSIIDRLIANNEITTNFLDDFYPPIDKNLLAKYRNIPITTNSADKLVVEMPIPGYKKENIDIEVQDQELVITAQANKENDIATGFVKSFKLLEDTDLNSCEATIENGLLTMQFSKIKNKAKHIKIK